MHVSSNRPVSEDEEKLMMYSPGGPFIMVAPVVTSWAVAGQRMVFLHMYLQTRVTLKAFPVVTPRGRSSKFPWRGMNISTWHLVVYSTSQSAIQTGTQGSAKRPRIELPWPDCSKITKPLTTAHSKTLSASIQYKPLVLLSQMMILFFYWLLYMSGLLLSPSSLMKSAVFSALERVWTN